MTTTTTPAPVALLDDCQPGPCGCFGCEKWADCAYCEACSPVIHPEGITGPEDAFNGPSNRHQSLAEAIWGEDIYTPDDYEDFQ